MKLIGQIRLWGLKRLAGLALAAVVAGAPFAGPALAQAAAPPKLDSGDTAWMLTSTALVLMMTIPGLALFYGGMVRRKNVIATVAQSFAITCLVTVLWMIVGYTTAFTTNPDANLNKYIGGFGAMMMRGVKVDQANALAGTIPESVFMMFQMTFAIITPALIAGAFAERMKFSALLLFTTLWSLFVYAPIAHWVWGGGFLGGLGVLDFAGGTVVHINAGVAGLMCALVLGKRKGYGTDNMAPHNLVFTMIGASLLWVGWFGFNAGSAVTSGALAGAAMLNTQVATAAAGLTWMVIEWIERRKPGMLGLASGAVAGLVAITPAAGFVNPQGALIVGVLGAAAAFGGAVWLKRLLKYDDSLDAFGVHGVAGVTGALLTGLLADATINPLGKDASLVKQLIGVSVTIAWTAVATLVILYICKFTIGLRVSEEGEVEGLDLALHGEALHE
jgi:Amt family ammonium transporter